MLIPDYGREIYNNTAPVDYDEYTDQTGFPAGKGYEVLTSRKAIVENEKNYIIKNNIKQYINFCGMIML